jgi:hypothetical protein
MPEDPEDGPSSNSSGWDTIRPLRIQSPSCLVKTKLRIVRKTLTETSTEPSTYYLDVQRLRNKVQ